MNPQITEPLSQLAGTLKRNMLRWHVGRVTFCPSCQAILDYRRAVEIDVNQNGHLVKSLVVFAHCFDGKEKLQHRECLNRVGGGDLVVAIIIPHGRKGHSQFKRRSGRLSRSQ